MRAYLLMFGVAEDHDSNPIKTGIGKMKARGAKFVSVNPVRTGYSAVADEWIGVRPGTDGLFVLALVPRTAACGQDRSRLSRALHQRPLARHRRAWRPTTACLRATPPASLSSSTRASTLWLARCRTFRRRWSASSPWPTGAGVPSFQHIAQRYLDASYSPDAVAARCGLSAETIRRIAAEIADRLRAADRDRYAMDRLGRAPPRKIRRSPVAMHAMRGISAHSNGFHTCRAIHLLQVLLGAVRCPGGFRFKPPFPKPPPGPKPSGRNSKPMTPLTGMPLGFVAAPEDLLLDDDGTPVRLDKAYSWEAPLAAHGPDAHGRSPTPGRAIPTG